MQLYNDNYVFILGAGFSAARGLPLIANFFDEMRDAKVWVEDTKRTAQESAITKVLEFRREGASAAYRVSIDLDNVEELFSLSAAAEPDDLQALQLSISATLSYSLKKKPEPMLQLASSDKTPFIHLASHANDNSNVATIPLYDAILCAHLRVLLSPEKNTILTFNYDDIVETSLRHMKIPYSYGFKPAIVDAMENRINPSGLKVLKLHGSTTWGMLPDRPGVLQVFTEPEALIDRKGVPVIVPPTWNKIITRELIDVWRQAVEALSKATKIIVIGFSMPPTDLHFKYLLAAGMRENLSLREVVFVDPSPSIETRARTLFAPREVDKGNVRFVQRTVQGLISNMTESDARGYRQHVNEATPY